MVTEHHLRLCVLNQVGEPLTSLKLLIIDDW